VSAEESEDLIEQHMGLVRRIAGHLIGKLPSTVQMDDLVQAGAVGLLEASRNFDPTRGASFETFAGIRIRGAMLDEVRRQNWAPRSAQRSTQKINAAIRAVESRLGRPAAPGEAAAEMGIDLESYHQLLSRSTESQLMNVEDILGSEADNIDSLPGDVGDPASEYEHQSLGSAIRNAIQALPKMDKTVLSLYYVEGLNLREIGEVFGVTETRISQIRSRALGRLRARLAEWRRDGKPDGSR
jgi:RNA polymerase sigma factor for flagellar operon FliA